MFTIFVYLFVHCVTEVFNAPLFTVRLFSVEFVLLFQIFVERSLVFVCHVSFFLSVVAGYLLCSLCGFFFVVFCSVICSVQSKPHCNT